MWAPHFCARLPVLPALLSGSCHPAGAASCALPTGSAVHAGGGRYRKLIMARSTMAR